MCTLLQLVHNVCVLMYMLMQLVGVRLGRRTGAQLVVVPTPSCAVRPDCAHTVTSYGFTTYSCTAVGRELVQYALGRRPHPKQYSVLTAVKPSGVLDLLVRELFSFFSSSGVRAPKWSGTRCCARARVPDLCHRRSALGANAPRAGGSGALRPKGPQQSAHSDDVRIVGERCAAQLEVATEEFHKDTCLQRGADHGLSALWQDAERVQLARTSCRRTMRLSRPLPSLAALLLPTPLLPACLA